MMIDPDQLNQLLHKQIDPLAKVDANLLATGLPASPGGARGRMVFDAHEAFEWVEKGE